MRIPGWLLPHDVTVEPYAGSGSFGDSYGDPFTVSAMWQGGHERTTDSDGAVVTVTVTMFTGPGMAAQIPTGSRLTGPGGAVAYVIEAYDRDDGGMGAPQHTEVHGG